ncbi:MAG: hypothetical protein AB7F64_02885 [Gammaproteobacteria bacterium]
MFCFFRPSPDVQSDVEDQRETLQPSEVSALHAIPIEPPTTLYRSLMNYFSGGQNTVSAPQDFRYYTAVEALQMIVDKSIYSAVSDKERIQLTLRQAIAKKVVDKKLMALLAISSIFGSIALYATYQTTFDYMAEMYEFLEVAIVGVPEIIQPFISTIVAVLRSGFYFATTAYASSQILNILAEKYVQNTLEPDDLQRAIESLRYYQQPRWKVLLSNLQDIFVNGLINVLPAVPYMIGYSEFSRTLTIMLMITNIFGPGQYAIRNVREGLTGTESLSQKAIVEHTDRAYQRFLKLPDDVQQLILDEIKFLIETKQYKGVYRRLLNIDEPTQRHKNEIADVETKKNIPWLLKSESGWSETIASGVGRAVFVGASLSILYADYDDVSEKINILKLWGLSLPAALVALLAAPSNLSNPYLAGQTIGEDLTIDEIPMAKLYVPMLRRLIKIGIISIALLPTGIGIETNVASIRLTKDFISWVGGNAEHPFALATQAIFGGLGGIVESATLGLFCLWALDAAVGNFVPECGTPHLQRLYEFEQSYRVFQESLKEAVPYQWRMLLAWMLDKNKQDQPSLDEEEDEKVSKFPKQSAIDLSELIQEIIHQRVSRPNFEELMQSYEGYGANIRSPQERERVLVINSANYAPSLFADGNGLRRRRNCKPGLLVDCLYPDRPSFSKD